MLTLNRDEQVAAKRRILVYLVDDTDGKTPETGVTLSAGDVKISKNGAAEANHAGTLTEIATGTYYYQFTAGELDTVGWVQFKLVKTGVRTFIKEVAVSGDKLRSATAQAGGTNTITLDASASSNDNAYNDHKIIITGGTGVGQGEFITGYVGSSRVATIARTSWETQPDSTSEFEIVPYGLSTYDSSTDTVTLAAATHTGATIPTVSTVTDVTNPVTADVTAVSGSATAANNLELDYDGTGYAKGSQSQVAAVSSAGRNDIANRILDIADGVESSFTLREALRLILSAAVGKVSGADSTTVTINDVNDTKARISATVDADGNRTAVSYTVD